MQQRSLYALTLAACLALPGGAHATLTLVTSRSDLRATDMVDWQDTGIIYSDDNRVTLPLNFTVSSQRGLQVGVSIPPPAPIQGPPITYPLVFQTRTDNIPTNFAPGDYILFTGLQPGPPPAIGNPGPLTIRFATPLWGVGAQVAVDDIPSYTLYLAVYDLADELIGSFDIAGASSTALDDSAVFFGVSSDTQNIAKLVYWSSENVLYGKTNRGFGINEMTLVPEPDGLFATGLVVLVGRRLAGSRKAQLRSDQCNAGDGSMGTR